MSTGKCTLTMDHHTDKVQAVAFNHYDHEVLLSGSFDRTIFMCPRQQGGTECGYYVMRFMYDLIRKDITDDNISTTLTSLEPYSKQDLEEIKEILARCFLRYTTQN